MDKKVVLKPGREKSVLRGHPWIFSGALESLPICDPGTILPVYSSQGEFLAQAYFHPDNSLTGRILSFQQGEIKKKLEQLLISACQLRKQLFEGQKTNAYRLINGEGDGLPGLIVDYYDGYLALQIHTQGIEKLRDFLIQQLVKILSPKGIYEKSLSPAREEDGLEMREGILYGNVPEKISILENGKTFLVSIPEGQKTGFFLDHRSMRQKVEEISKNRRVLNCFSYTGAFSIYALKGGAKEVTSIDSCKTACRLAEENTEINQLKNHQILQADVFDYLESHPIEQDLVILDPPAFAKKRKHLDNALKAYQKINYTVLKGLPPRSFLLTSSCSYHVTEELFVQAVFFAAEKAKRNARILSRHLQAADHPISLNHPEGAYLKSLLLFVE